MTYLAAAADGDPVAGGLLFFGILVALLVWWRIDLRRHPWLPCRTCGGRAREKSPLRGDAWGACPGCSGTGRRPRRITRRRDS